MKTLVERFLKLEAEVGDKLGTQYIIDTPYKQRDVVALIILAEILNSDKQALISASVKGALVFDVDAQVLDKKASDEMIKNLIRCGVTFLEYTQDKQTGYFLIMR